MKQKEKNEIMRDKCDIIVIFPKKLKKSHVFY